MYKKGLLAIDLSECESWAKALAAARQHLSELIGERVPEGIEVRQVVGPGTVYEKMFKAARAVVADLIVMASHRPELKDYLLGPNAARVVRHSNRSVLVVRE